MQLENLKIHGENLKILKMLFPHVESLDQLAINKKWIEEIADYN
jgi:hypothetical protein